MADCDWSTLPEELLRLIAVRLFSLVELNRFRSICSSWRSSASGADNKHHFRSRPTLRHLSFVTTKQKNRVSNTYHLMFLSRAAFFRVTLSSSKQGWLIKSDEDINSKKLHLLDPFSRVALPHSRESLDLLEFTVSETGEAYAALTKRRGETDRDFKKVVLVKANGWNQQLLGISRERYIKSWDGEFWSRLEEMSNRRFSDIIVHKGLTYALDLQGTVWWIDSRLRIYAYGPLFEETITNGCCIEKSFVECCGELYIVERLFEESSRKRKADSLDSSGKGLKTVGFKVYKMDEELAKWVEVKSLGDNAFVMATDTNFSVLANEFCGCLHNSVYFVDNEESEMKAFKLDNGNGCIETMSEFSESCFQMFVPSFL
ncbi:PREDICTED: putative F-box protein At1g65770 [Camelina sativa]|uniref:F-box protein At1g65770 n=1 Tax=Camelina sativa TaxID=90675 RepID=A0ABM0WFQ2_CAMSA|nr:PREDICTED: putative F-box protein At1g65770 [Camelina sativa]